jgi:Na+-translocating ferredoxin:NAD+ oxidoreductase RnfD subunit
MPAVPCAPVIKKGGRFAQIKPFLAPLLITCILLVGDLTYSILPSYKFTALAILSSIFLEIVLRRVATGQWPRWLHLASCYITGISVGILVQAYVAWPFILCSMLSISSKYALRIKGRHLWNPSNLGVSILLFLEVIAPLSQQWGNEMWPLLIIMCLGSIILYTLGRLHITVTYAAAFVVLSIIRSSLTGDVLIAEIAIITQPAYQLFMFFMITDPATTTRTKGRRCAVAILIAIVETVLRLNREIHAPYYALFITAPVTNLLEMWWDGREARQAAAAVATSAPLASSNGNAPVQALAAERASSP